MEKIDYSNFIEEKKEEYLEDIKSDEIIDEITGGACPWWNISCQLGNTGSYCTLSVECMPGCH